MNLAKVLRFFCKVYSRCRSVDFEDSYEVPMERYMCGAENRTYYAGENGGSLARATEDCDSKFPIGPAFLARPPKIEDRETLLDLMASSGK